MDCLKVLYTLFKLICNIVSSARYLFAFRKQAQKEKMNAANWLAMLPEIMEMISDRLPVKDFLSFRAVCKTWQSLPSGRSDISKFSTDKLWLLFYGSNEEKCYLYGSNHSKACTFHLHDLKGATVMHSKFGWLIARKNNHFFLFNFFTLAKINLPDHAVSEDQACTFTTLPLQKDCTVFIVTRKSDINVEVSSCHVGDKKWEVELLDIKKSDINFLNSVMCCSCSPHGKSCTCTLQTKILFASKDLKRVTYDYVSKSITFYSTSFFGSSCYVIESKNDIEARHKNAWVRRFGSEKGVAVRFCTLSFSVDVLVGLKNGVNYFSASSSESVQNYNFVKAALIDTKYIRIEDVTSFGWT